MRDLKISMLIALTLLLASTITLTASAATEEEIELSIEEGLAWLAAQQNPDGGWGDDDSRMTAVTAFALIKLQMRARELGYDSPFDPEYPYSGNVKRGWEYMFEEVNNTPTHSAAQAISPQTHDGTADDPDVNGNGIGVLFLNPSPFYNVYTTGITVMALEASGTRDRVNDGGIDYDGDGSADTFMEVAQDAVEWLAFAQGDSGNDEGGWDYRALDNQTDDASTDNSNSGYAALGIAAGEAFGCSVPEWLKEELDVWIGTIQDPVDGDDDDGGSWYNPDWPENPWVNELKAGNLIFEMTLAGDTPSEPRFGDAMDYIARHWRDEDNDPGWGYNRDPSHYQAMYCLMKGLEYSRVERIDLDGVGVPEHDWYQEFADVIVAQQNPDGSWPSSDYGDDILNTIWALLTLERIAPPPPPPPVGGAVYPVDKLRLYAIIGAPTLLAAALVILAQAKRK